jgi:hypothetical protein
MSAELAGGKAQRGCLRQGEGQGEVCAVSQAAGLVGQGAQGPRGKDSRDDPLAALLGRLEIYALCG